MQMLRSIEISELNLHIVFIFCKIKRCVRKIYFLPFESCLRSCTETSIRQWPPIFKLHKKAAFLLSTKDDHSCLKKNT